MGLLSINRLCQQCNKQDECCADGFGLVGPSCLGFIPKPLLQAHFFNVMVGYFYVGCKIKIRGFIKEWCHISSRVIMRYILHSLNLKGEL